jgi:hypothetical protein
MEAVPQCRGCTVNLFNPDHPFFFSYTRIKDPYISNIFFAMNLKAKNQIFKSSRYSKSELSSKQDTCPNLSWRKNKGVIMFF